MQTGTASLLLHLVHLLQSERATDPNIDVFVHVSIDTRLHGTKRTQRQILPQRPQAAPVIPQRENKSESPPGTNTLSVVSRKKVAISDPDEDPVGDAADCGTCGDVIGSQLRDVFRHMVHFRNNQQLMKTKRLNAGQVFENFSLGVQAGVLDFSHNSETASKPVAQVMGEALDIAFDHKLIQSCSAGVVGVQRVLRLPDSDQGRLQNEFISLRTRTADCKTSACAASDLLSYASNTNTSLASFISYNANAVKQIQHAHDKLQRGSGRQTTLTLGTIESQLLFDLFGPRFFLVSHFREWSKENNDRLMLALGYLAAHGEDIVFLFPAHPHRDLFNKAAGDQDPLERITFRELSIVIAMMDANLISMTYLDTFTLLVPDENSDWLPREYAILQFKHDPQGLQMDLGGKLLPFKIGGALDVKLAMPRFPPHPRIPVSKAPVLGYDVFVKSLFGRGLKDPLKQDATVSSYQSYIVFCGGGVALDCAKMLATYTTESIDYIWKSMVWNSAEEVQPTVLNWQLFFGDFPMKESIETRVRSSDEWYRAGSLQGGSFLVMFNHVPSVIGAKNWASAPPFRNLQAKMFQKNAQYGHPWDAQTSYTSNAAPNSIFYYLRGGFWVRKKQGKRYLMQRDSFNQADDLVVTQLQEIALPYLEIDG